MLESMMTARNNCEEDVKQSLSFIQELLKETEKQRKVLDTNAKETIGTKDTEETTADDSTTDETTDGTTGDSQPSIVATIGRHLDARTHIVGELYDTEKSFCEQLKDLTEKYAKPLTESQIIETQFVETIFGRIPEILEIHSRFLEGLRRRITSWSQNQTVGDLFAIFEESTCSDAYLSFVDNWFESKRLVKQLSQKLPQFQRHLTDQSREHRNKLSLDELMIAVIQRIPRLELLLKQLLKNTRDDHKDHPLLSRALKKIHSLVLYINRVKNVSSEVSSVVGTSSQISINQLMEICDGLPVHLISGQNLCLISEVLIRKRERILLLFGQLLAIVALKGRKKSEKFCENKYKVLNHFSLDFLEIDFQVFEENIEVLEKDFQTVQSIQNSFLPKLSQNSRQFLDSVFTEFTSSLAKRMNEMKNSEKNLELVVRQTDDNKTTADGSVVQNSICLTFRSREERQKFEQIFKELKFKPNSKIIPEFLCFLPIRSVLSLSNTCPLIECFFRKTRAGLQFTCASPTLGTNDVWICNSDGFVGQISVLSLNWTTLPTTHSTTVPSLEPTIVSSNGVCNSRIICMTCVPKSTQTSSQSPSSEESEGLLSFLALTLVSLFVL